MLELLFSRLNGISFFPKWSAPIKEIIMWRCTICGYIYDDAKEGTKFEDLSDDWSCPVCNAPKDAFVRI